ncbi:MAG: dephospho-CoA kinase [Bradymonadales bacterium]|nr:dephospho-CoA kinase [Bradymonadales bacterium]
MKLFGLTGNTGTGKSTVARMLAGLGIAVVDADLLARQVVEPGQPALEEIRAEFGDQFFDSEGRLDRKALGRLVFGDRKALERLEAIVHPRILALAAERIRALERGGAQVVVFDAAALLEAGLAAMFDGLIVVTSDREQQVSRIMDRDGLTRQDADRRMAAQMPSDQKVRAADRVVDNSGTLQELEEEVRLLAAWLVRK